MALTSIPPASVFRNCIKVVETSKGFLPLRFSPRQFKAYEVDPGRTLRARCAAGVTLDFLSETTQIKLNYEIGGMVRDWAFFDLLVDGILVGREGQQPTSPGPGQISFEIPGSPGLKRMTLYLPHNVEIFIKDILVDDAHFSPTPIPPKKLLTMGDSITQGMEAHHPSTTYAALLAQTLGVSLLNQGVGGHVFDEKTVDPAMGFEPDLITAAYGTNDWNKYQNPGDFKISFQSFLAALTGAFPKIPICLIAPTWRHDFQEKKGVGRFEDLHQIIRECAGVYPKIQTLDGRKLVPNLNAYFADGLHPTDEGFFAYTLALLPHLQKYFRESQSVPPGP